MSIDYGDLLLPNGKVLIREAYKTTSTSDWVNPGILPPLPIQEVDGTRPVGIKIYYNQPEFWYHCFTRHPEPWNQKRLVPGYYIFNPRGSLFRSISNDGDFHDWICIRDKAIPESSTCKWRPTRPEDNLPSWIVEVDENRV
jgi:hypothetical protein